MEEQHSKPEGANGLAEIDRLILRLSEVEGWDQSLLTIRMDERRRNPPGNIPLTIAILKATIEAGERVPRPAMKVNVLH